MAIVNELVPLPTLRVRLLGGFGVERDGDDTEVSGWRRRSAKTLTKLVAAHPRHALHREQVLDILWPGADTESALNSFGKALHAARRAIEPGLSRRQGSAYLRLEDAMLAFDMEHVAIDADEFERRAQNALRGTEVAALEAALAAYGGELLPEDRYEDWCAERRRFLTELHIRVLLTLADAFERRGACNEAADRLREVLRKDHTREEVHRRLMRLYAEMGTPDQAVRQFHRCEEALRSGLDLAPQRDTVRLYQDILASRIPQLGSPPARAGVQASPVVRPASGPADRPFIGRGPVLNYLCQQLSRPAAGPGMILISGEAGVGKTRLLEELAGEASRRGAAVLWGGSGAHAQQFAWGPFAVALEGYAASRPAAGRSELAQRYPPLAGFVPSLGLRQGPVMAVSGASDPQLDLIPAIVRLLTDLACSQPLLLVLGDLHQADAFSLDLVRYLAQLAVKRPWLIAGAARPEELDGATELGQMLEAATRERLCQQIELGCLLRRDCDELVRAMDPGSTVGPELAAQIYQWSRGNPLFVEELVRELQRQAEPGAERGPGRIPDGQPSWSAAHVPARVRALTAVQLARIDETLRRVLGLAATAPAAVISLAELRAGAGALDPPVTNAALFSALDRALGLGLLEERAQGYAFRHPLIRSALYEGLSRHRRDQLRAALGVPGTAARAGSA